MTRLYQGPRLLIHFSCEALQESRGEVAKTKGSPGLTMGCAGGKGLNSKPRVWAVALANCREGSSAELKLLSLEIVGHIVSQIPKRICPAAHTNAQEGTLYSWAHTRCVSGCARLCLLLSV